MRIAALTMVYNEPDFLPIWIGYYSRHVGASNCFVLDHGSDDGSVNQFSSIVSIVPVPRSPMDDVKRANLVSRFVDVLLAQYDFVIYTDVDEIVFPDPRQHSTFCSFCKATSDQVITAFGFELIQMLDLEPNLNITAPILSQRQWVRFASPMCKPVLVSKPVTWAPGFHCTMEPVTFGGIFLFHLRWADFDIGLRRLQRSRSQPWADPTAGSWQRVTDKEYRSNFAAMGKVPRIESCSFLAIDPLLKNAVNYVLNSQIGRENETYKIGLDIWSHDAWRVPKALKLVF